MNRVDINVGSLRGKWKLRSSYMFTWIQLTVLIKIVYSKIIKIVYVSWCDLMRDDRACLVGDFSVKKLANILWMIYRLCFCCIDFSSGCCKQKKYEHLLKKMLKIIRWSLIMSVCFCVDLLPTELDTASFSQNY